MAKRTSEQNRAIYQRRAERARQRGSTYSKERRTAEKAKDVDRVKDHFRSLGATEKQIKKRLDQKGWTQKLLHDVAKGGVDFIMRHAGKNPLLWYHFQ